MTRSALSGAFMLTWDELLLAAFRSLPGCSARVDVCVMLGGACREREQLSTRSSPPASSPADSSAREENGSGNGSGAAEARGAEGNAPSSPWAPPEGSHASRPSLAPSKSGRWDGERERCDPSPGSHELESAPVLRRWATDAVCQLYNVVSQVIAPVNVSLPHFSMHLAGLSLKLAKCTVCSQSGACSCSFPSSKAGSALHLQGARGGGRGLRGGRGCAGGDGRRG